MANTKYLHYLEEMEHYDKDNRYMGASDLCNLICSDGANFDAEKERKCIAAFIKQLDDNSTEVQGKAVQCLAKIASKIKEDNLGNILKKVADCIVNGDKDFRDIYSICCKSIMAEITDTYAPTVIKSCYPILQTGIKAKDEEVQEECVELLSEMLKRFATNIIQDQTLIKEKAILDQLFLILSASAPYTLKKKVAYCIGCLAVILSSSNIQTLMESLIKSINDNMKKEGDLFYYILALSWVSRKIGYKLGSYLESLILNLINICDSLDAENSSDQLNEIAEEALNCLESLIKHCPREISKYIEKLLEVAQDRMTYDPIYDYECEDDMDVDDEGEGWDDDELDGDEAQDDDSSWKVRRGSLNLIISVITTRPEMLRALYSNLSQRLIDRFKERENKIKALVFNAFSVLLKTTSIIQTFDNESLIDNSASLPDMMKQRSSTEELFGQVPAIVKSLLKETSTKNTTVKIAILECLAEMTKALRDQLNPFFVDILPIIRDSVIGESNTAQIIPSLVALKNLLQYSNKHEDYQKKSEEILEIILASLKNEHFSVKAEGLLATSSFTKILSTSSTDNSTNVGKLNEVVLSCMDASENAIIAISHILSSCHKSLSKSEIDDNVDILIEKLNNDMKRIAALRAINRICASTCGLKSHSEKIVKSVTPLLSKSDNAVKMNSLEVLNSFVGKYGDDVKPKLNDILTATLNIITTENLQVADWALDLLTKLSSHKLKEDSWTEAIHKVTSLTESSFLLEKTITKILKFFRALAKNNNSLDYEEHIKFLESKVTINCTVPARCIAEILAEYSDLNTKFTTKYLKGLEKDDNTIIVSSLILGEIGRLNDLSKNKDLTTTIDELFNHSNSDVKIAASHCLGHICIGNLKYFLPIVIEFINNEPKHKFLLLMSIREIIDTKLQDVTDHFETLSGILFENAKSSEEKIRNVVSECLGKLFAASGLEMLQEFESRLSSTNQLVRSTIAKCIKYAATKEADPTAISALLPDIIELASDTEHQIRQFTLESLISIAHHLPELLRGECETLSKIITGEVELKKELIKEVDLGPFKHKIDEGRPIRKAGLVLLDTMFEKMPERINVPVTLDIILIGLSDPDDDCVAQALHILIKMVKWAPGAVVGQMSNILDKLPPILKTPEKGTTKSSYRIALKAMERMSHIPDMETNTVFQKFVQDNHITMEE